MASSMALGEQTRYLESFELRGSTRLSSETLQKIVDIKQGDKIDDSLIPEMRAKILGLGLFRQVLFSLQKGKDPAKVILVASVVDDPGVVGNAAIGGELGLRANGGSAAFEDNSLFRSYHFGFVARNLFSNRHRASLTADIDAQGSLAAGSAAYGLPRFTQEAVQFDASASVSDPSERYLETQAFGIKSQSLWTQSVNFIDLQYGAVWYTNTHQKYRLNSWPETVAGPKLGLIHDNRFLGFLPSQGWRMAASFIPSLVKRDQAIIESQISGTWFPASLVALTGDFQATTVGKSGVTTRATARVDVPITDKSSEGTKAVVFSMFRQGYDRFQEKNYKGSDAVFGLRYYSTGFIGELSFQITKKEKILSSSNLVHEDYPYE